MAHESKEKLFSRTEYRRVIAWPERIRREAPFLAEALDVITACGFDVGGAAGVLGITMSQLAKLVRHERHAFATVNAEREKRGLPGLK